MAETSSDFCNWELRERADRIFYGIAYEDVPLHEWFGDELEYADEGKEPLLAWERETIGRDIMQGLEVVASDRIALFRKISGELCMERHVCLDTEDDDEETIDFYSMNMYSGEIAAENGMSYESIAQDFENRFRIVEDI